MNNWILGEIKTKLNDQRNFPTTDVKNGNKIS